VQSDVLLYFLALFLPPVPVFLKRGCGADLLINIALDFLGWIPGVIRMLLPYLRMLVLMLGCRCVVYHLEVGGSECAEEEGVARVFR
jgi:uncharacterized membrane protein YqaE (UPF0057 family)